MAISALTFRTRFSSPSRKRSTSTRSAAYKPTATTPAMLSSNPISPASNAGPAGRVTCSTPSTRSWSDDRYGDDRLCGLPNRGRACAVYGLRWVKARSMLSLRGLRGKSRGALVAWQPEQVLMQPHVHISPDHLPVRLMMRSR